jgi:RND family efflux transporter MFP subunit
MSDVSDTLSSDLAALKIDRTAPPARRRRGPVRLVIALVCAGLALAGYGLGKPYLEAQFFKTPVEVTEIALISPAQAAIELSSSGYVVPQVRSQVGARIPGRVAKLYVREGDRVQAGQVLIELEQSSQQAAIAAARQRAAVARAHVATARAGLNEVRRQAERTAQLVDHGAAPAAQAEDLGTRVTSLAEQVKAAEAEVSAAEAEITTLKVNLDYMTITAPISGTVLNKPPEVGEVLGNDFGIGTTTTGTIELAEMSSLNVETDVPEGRLHAVRIGSPCEIVLDTYPQRRFRGEAIEIMPRVNRAKATVGVKVKFVDATDGVLPDMAARVSFLSAHLDADEIKAEPRLVVPAAAVAERGGRKVVFVVDGDVVRETPVALGPPFAEGFVLERGPEAGTKVVKAPPQTLSNGSKIKERVAS